MFILVLEGPVVAVVRGVVRLMLMLSFAAGATIAVWFAWFVLSGNKAAPFVNATPPMLLLFSLAWLPPGSALWSFRPAVCGRQSGSYYVMTLVSLVVIGGSVFLLTLLTSVS